MLDLCCACYLCSVFFFFFFFNDTATTEIYTLSLHDALPISATGGTSSDRGGGVLGSLTSYFGGNFVNDFRTYVSVDHRNASAFLTLPQGRVQVASNLTDTNRGVTTFGFGGNAGFPQ